MTVPSVGNARLFERPEIPPVEPESTERKPPKGEAIMANDDANEARAYGPPPEPSPGLRALDRMIGEWEVSGDYVRGSSSYEWMEGGYFLIQRYDFERPDGQKISGIEVIGHERPFGSGPSEHVRSRAYTNTGDTLDYVYELEGDTLTIWGGEKGSPAYYRGEFGDGDTLAGRWRWPGGGYEATSTRIT
jgi:hypothetical protein